LSAGPAALDVAHERLEKLEVPVVSGFPFGHEPARNAALIFGGQVRLEADHGTLISLEGLDEAAQD
jgi:muramoyltetrapeptide carboxypeptidase LdcA involved in peptidoglycan recycling